MNDNARPFLTFAARHASQALAGAAAAAIVEGVLVDLFGAPKKSWVVILARGGAVAVAAHFAGEAVTGAFEDRQRAESIFA